MNFALFSLLSFALAEAQSPGDSPQAQSPGDSPQVEQYQQCGTQGCATNTDPTSLLMTKSRISESSGRHAKKDNKLDEDHNERKRLDKTSCNRNTGQSCWPRVRPCTSPLTDCEGRRCMCKQGWCARNGRCEFQAQAPAPPPPPPPPPASLCGEWPTTDFSCTNAGGQYEKLSSDGGLVSCKRLCNNRVADLGSLCCYASASQGCWVKPGSTAFQYSGSHAQAINCQAVTCTVPTISIAQGAESWGGTNCASGASNVAVGTICTITPKSGFTCTGPGLCLDNGNFAQSASCEPPCNRNTGQSCWPRARPCTNPLMDCEGRRCMCKQGWCARNGRCEFQVRGSAYQGSGNQAFVQTNKTKAFVQTNKTKTSCSRNTGGTCGWFPCHGSRGPTDCTGGRCMCQQGYCAHDGECLVEAPTPSPPPPAPTTDWRNVGCTKSDWEPIIGSVWRSNAFQGVDKDRRYRLEEFTEIVSNHVIQYAMNPIIAAGQDRGLMFVFSDDSYIETIQQMGNLENPYEVAGYQSDHARIIYNDYLGCFKAEIEDNDEVTAAGASYHLTWKDGGRARARFRKDCQDTGGTCFSDSCYHYRNAVCSDGVCTCRPGDCTNDQGVCVTAGAGEA